MRAEHIAAAIALLWPLVLTTSVTVLRWKHLRSRAGFVIIGFLACVGVCAVMAALGHYLFWGYFAHLPPQYFLTAARFTNTIAATVAGAILSVPLVLWLSMLLGRSLTPNNRWRGP